MGPTRDLMELSPDERRAAAIEEMKKVGERASAILEDIFIYTVNPLASPVNCLKFMMDDLSELEVSDLIQLKEEKDKVVAGVRRTLENLFHSNDECDHSVIAKAHVQQSNALDEFTDFIMEAPRAIENGNYKEIIEELIYKKGCVTAIGKYHHDRPLNAIKRKELIIEAAKEIGIDLGLDPYTLYGERLDELSFFFRKRNGIAESKLIGAFCVLLGKDVPPDSSSDGSSVGPTIFITF